MKKMLLALHKDTPITCSDKPVAMDTENTPSQPQPMIFVSLANNVQYILCTCISQSSRQDNITRAAALRMEI